MPNQLVGDQNTLSDAAVGFVVYSVGFSDTIALSDSIIASGAVFRTNIGVSDRLFLTDVVDFQTAGLGILIGDTLNLVDALSTGRTQANAVSDTITLSDLLQLTQTQGYLFADSITFSDAAVYTLGSIFTPLTVTTSDTLLFSDVVSFINPTSQMSISDSMPGMRDSILVNFGTTLDPYLRRYLNDVN